VCIAETDEEIGQSPGETVPCFTELVDIFAPVRPAAGVDDFSIGRRDSEILGRRQPENTQTWNGDEFFEGVDDGRRADVVAAAEVDVAQLLKLLEGCQQQAEWYRRQLRVLRLKHCQGAGGVYQQETHGIDAWGKIVGANVQLLKPRGNFGSRQPHQVGQSQTTSGQPKHRQRMRYPAEDRGHAVPHPYPAEIEAVEPRQGFQGASELIGQQSAGLTRRDHYAVGGQVQRDEVDKQFESWTEYVQTLISDAVELQTDTGHKLKTTHQGLIAKRTPTIKG